MSVPRDGLPANIDAERFVLGSILNDDARFVEAAKLTADDFAIEKHRRIFRRMLHVHVRGEAINYVTVTEELKRNGELESVDGISYLVSLTDGLPYLSSIASYIGVLKEKSAERRALIAFDYLSTRVGAGESIAEIVAAGQELLAGIVTDAGRSMSIDEIPSVRACGAAEIEYIRDPELPKGAVIGLTGDSGSGKSTLATAWARDAHDVPILFLDRENPVSIIIDRLNRVGFADCPRLHFWGGWLPKEPPLPDDPIVLAWVRSCEVKPLIIVDSLVAFHGGDENSAGEMRTLMQRCRRLADLGATVIVIHHDGKGDSSKDYRGSSDFKASLDLGFHVSNFGPTGLLDKLVLRPWKTRIQCAGELGYEYADGRFRPVGNAETRQTVSEQLHVLLRLNPGITATKFADLVAARGLGRDRGRKYLNDGVLAKSIHRKIGANNVKTYFLPEENDDD